MRFMNIHKTAATKANPKPFAGLGFVMDAVRDEAQSMTVVLHAYEEWRGLDMPAPDFVAQPSGYSLLVTLSREIRGR